MSRVFSFASNRFSGPVPVPGSISKMASMSNLILTGNLLNGHIPDGIKKLKNLIKLDLSDNQISGNIPDFFSSFTQLRLIMLSENKLVGTLPPSVVNLPPGLAK